ncbi:tail fiber assembly protein [Xenorhabdus sp. PB30.3]|uniref:tail fiber assembly protein n=1 Tax=Xenorhabdus sp. PB30.3 TaxID=2788941 RepID=UPI001E3D7862|nr:tail fiber assembly protein [Xenorhabdus sp. PB30.3]MCC8379142.1 tail fiber assembly protein [Xenorhabdus sp. PB30.3]
MLKMKNFKEYKPDNIKFGNNVIYLISDDGQDWYECQKKYREDTLKVEYYSDGTIVRTSKDVSRLCPYNASVLETEFNEDFDISQYHVVNDELVKKSEEILLKEAQLDAEKFKKSLISDAQKNMQLLQTKLLMGRISETERKKLNQWLDYVEAVEVLDISAVSDIQWPEHP